MADFIPAAAAAEWRELVWAAEAVTPPCRRDPDLWFSETREAQELAADACRTCPLLDRCLSYAVAARERHGVWGGTTPNERAELFRSIEMEERNN